MIRDYDIAFQILSDPAARRKNNLHNGYGEEYLRDRKMPEMHLGMQAVLDKRNVLKKSQSTMELNRANSINSQSSTSSDITDSELFSGNSSPVFTGRSSPVFTGGERGDSRGSSGKSSPKTNTTSPLKFNPMQNPTKRRTVGPRNTKVVSPPTDYEKDAGKTRIKFKDAQGKHGRSLSSCSDRKREKFFY